MVALVARTLGGIGATIVVLVATKLTVDWFDSREIVLAMSILQMSWPFGAMLALPIQAFIAQRLGMACGNAVQRRSAPLPCFLLSPSFRSGEQPPRPAAIDRARLPVAVLLPGHDRRRRSGAR